MKPMILAIFLSLSCITVCIPDDIIEEIRIDRIQIVIGKTKLNLTLEEIKKLKSVLDELLEKPKIIKPKSYFYLDNIPL